VRGERDWKIKGIEKKRKARGEHDEREKGEHKVVHRNSFTVVVAIFFAPSTTGAT
jgi:hypothetical protein